MQLNKLVIARMSRLKPTKKLLIIFVSVQSQKSKSAPNDKGSANKDYPFIYRFYGCGKFYKIKSIINEVKSKEKIND